MEFIKHANGNETMVDNRILEIYNPYPKFPLFFIMKDRCRIVVVTPVSSAFHFAMMSMTL